MLNTNSELAGPDSELAGYIYWSLVLTVLFGPFIVLVILAGIGALALASRFWLG